MFDLEREWYKINNKLKTKIKRYYTNKYNNYKENKMNKKRIHNSTSFTNVNSIDDDGYIDLKSGDIAYLIEVKAIDLSLSSKEEKESFFTYLKTLYQISGINLKCYKLDEKINLNSNKCNLDKLIEKNKNSNKEILLKENRKLIFRG